MTSPAPSEFQSLVLMMRLPLVWIGGAITAFGTYRTYAFLKKEREMSAFLERHPMGSEQTYLLRKAIGLHGDVVAWKLLGVGLVLIVLGLSLDLIVAQFRKDGR